MVVSLTNQCRSIIVAWLYLMMKFRWGAHRTLEYLSTKKPNLVITMEILSAFEKLEGELKNEPTVFKTTK